MKAILVIDVPNKCSECGFYYDNKDNKMSCYIDDYIKDCKGDCPLKPMPKKLEVDVKKIEDIMRVEYQMVDVIQDKIIAEIKLNTDKLIALGWNSCIDEILGG